MKSKKGADKTISVYWFVILFLVAGAVVYMVWAFYGNPIDVRSVEADVMINQVADCLSQNGKLIHQLTKDFEDRFMKDCHLNFNTEFEGQGEYYLEVSSYDFSNLNVPLSFMYKGNINLNETKTNMPNSNSMLYSEKSFYTLSEKDGNQQEIVVKILSIIRKTEKNVR